MSNRAERIIKRSIKKVCEDIPEFAIVLNKLELKEVEEPVRLSTDWKHILYNGEIVEKEYDHSKIRDLLVELVHIVLHGILEDIEELKSDKFLDDEFRNAFIDYKADVMLNYLGYRNWGIDEVDKSLMIMHHSAIKPKTDKYFMILEQAKYKKSDEHSYWREENPINEWGELRQSLCENTGKEDSIQALQSIQMKNQNGMMAGEGSDGFEERVKAADFEGKSYKEIIKELVMKESETREMPDTIDTTLYQYGLSLYGDVPLVEPNEEEGKNNMGTLFVAVDTSGSCQGEMLEEFLRELRTLFLELRDNFSEGEIILLHCDDAIHKEEHYELSDICEFGSEHSFYGTGGTSFIPVFDRIEQYKKEEKKDIVGLVYLTDGEGMYPEREAKYPVYFVMEKDYYEHDMDRSIMPNWIKVVTF